MEPQINPLFVSRTLKVLKCVCHACSEILISKREYMDSCLKLKAKSQERIDFILKDIKNVSLCSSCGAKKKDYSEKNCIFYENGAPMKVKKIQEILEKLSIFTLNMLGISTLSHPKNAILSAFPVLPLNCRPAVVSEGNVCQDDMTHQLNEILKNNRNIKLIYENKQHRKKNQLEDQLEKCRDNISFRIQTFFNNSLGKAKHASGRPIASMRDRLSGKTGIIRNHIIGKRLNQTARTVISPDPYLKTDEVGIPERFAHVLTTTEIVNPFNKRRLTNLANSGGISLLERDGFTYDVKCMINFPGDRLEFGDEFDGEKVKRKKTGKFDDFYAKPRKYWVSLKIGDRIHRFLKNGDLIVVNRQPTLHKGSMMALRCKLQPTSTICLNLAVTKPFNADFDGDEMTIHVPQTVESFVEAELLMTPGKCLMSYSGKPTLTIVQDSLIGAYLMSLESIHQDTISKGRFFDAILSIDRVERWKRLALTHPRMNGKTLISLLFPDQFSFTKDEVVVRNGVLLEGTLTNDILNGKRAIVQQLYFLFGEDMCLEFLSNIQFLTNFWLLEHGFSIHLGDCIVNNDFKTQIKSEWESDWASSRTRHDPMKMNDLCDRLMKAALNNLPDSNNFLVTEKSGAKGNVFNICQITCSLGQQTINEQFLPEQIHVNKDIFKRYGFVESSFASGLSPKEFFHHSMAGRKGVADTAVSTAISGYSQRCSVKLMEDMIIQSDRTIRDSNRKLYQFAFGHLGFDPSKILVKDDGTITFFDVKERLKRLECVCGEGEDERRQLDQLEFDKLVSFISPRPNIPVAVESWIVSRLVQCVEKMLDSVVVCTCHLEFLRKELPNKYYEALFQPGECVGVIAAQCMGEFATQATLNTFHIAGSNVTGKITSAINKSQELKNATKNPKIIYYKLYFNDNNFPAIESIRQVLFCDLILNDISYKDIEVEGTWWSNFMSVDITQFSNLTRFKLDPRLLFQYKIYPLIVKQRIEAVDQQCICAFPPLSSELFVFDIYHNNTSKDLLNILISGIEGVTFIERFNDHLVCQNFSGKGSLRKILMLPNIDHLRTMTSHAWDIFDCFGIEATRKFMLDSYQSIMPGVNAGFVSLMVDRQTHNGTISSISRYSMRGDDGVLARASFEECIENLIQASQNSSRDELKSLAARIIVSQKVLAGTNFFDCIGIEGI